MTILNLIPDPDVLIPNELVVGTSNTVPLEGKVSCSIRNAKGKEIENRVSQLPDGTRRINYILPEEGAYNIDVAYNNVPIPGSPFTVHAKSRSDSQKCSAYGPGLKNGVLNKSNVFTVETKEAGVGGLSLAIEGPSEAKMTCRDNRDGSCTVEYVPTEPGEYDLAIKFADRHIPGSPFKVQVEPDVGDEKYVTAYGPGLDNAKCRFGVPAKFTIDASKANPAPLAVNITSDSSSLHSKPEIKDNGDGTYDVTYIPPAEGSNLTANILYNGKDIPNSPFLVKVRPTCEPEKVILKGPPAYESGIPASLPATVKIDPTQAGYGDLEVKCSGPDGTPRKVKVEPQKDGTYDVTFVPDDCGRYKFDVKYGSKPISHSPAYIQAVATGNVSPSFSLCISKSPER